MYKYLMLHINTSGLKKVDDNIIHKHWLNCSKWQMCSFVLLSLPPAPRQQYVQLQKKPHAQVRYNLKCDIISLQVSHGNFAIIKN